MKFVRGIALPDSDTHFEQQILANPVWAGMGTYQFRKFDRMMKLIPEACRRSAVDVGAHVGLWSRVMALKFRRVTAFEANPAMFECLQHNTAPSGKVTVFQCALGDKQGQASLAIDEANTGNTHIEKMEELGSIPLTAVPVSRLDSFTTWEPDFIKIDVEGYEYFVIKGGEATIKRYKPFMLVEQKPGHAERHGIKTGDAINLLRSWGARVAFEDAGDYAIVWS